MRSIRRPERWISNLDNMLPGQRGEYHVVSAYSSRHNCLVYGGGNLFQGESPVDRQIWRMNADLSKTRMPDAPHHVGIYQRDESRRATPRAGTSSRSGSAKRGS